MRVCTESGFNTSKLAYIALLRNTTDLDHCVELMSGKAGSSSLQSEAGSRIAFIGKWTPDHFQTSLNFLRWQRGIDYPGPCESDRIGSPRCFASTVKERSLNHGPWKTRALVQP